MELLDDTAKLAHSFLFSRKQQANYADRRPSSRDVLLERLLTQDEGGQFYTDENGHKYYDFPSPVTIEGVKYKGVAAQRRTSSEIDIGATEHLLRQIGQEAFDRVFRKVTVRQFQEDELYLMNQEGAVSDDQLDSLLVEHETWAVVA